MESTAVTPELVIRAVLELLFLLAVVGGLLFFTDLRKRLYPFGAAALTTVFIFFGAWGVIQMVDRWQYDYPQQASFVPLTRFAMYQAQLTETVEASYSWQATLADGSTREVNVADEFSAVGLPPMSTRMRVLLSWMWGPEGSDRDRAEEELTLFATALVRALEEDGLEVDEIAFSRLTGTPGAADSELLISWNVDELEGR